MNNVKIIPIYFIVTAIVFLVVLTCSPLEVDLGGTVYENPLKIGLFVPLSVERTDEGIAFFATNLATEEINREGGVLGRELEIVLVNDGGASAQEIKKFAQKIQKDIKDKTGIVIETEVTYV